MFWWKEVEERCEVNVKSVLLKKAHILSQNIEKWVAFIKDMINSSTLGYFWKKIKLQEFLKNPLF